MKVKEILKNIKLLTLFLAVALTVSLTACTNGSAARQNVPSGDSNISNSSTSTNSSAPPAGSSKTTAPVIQSKESEKMTEVKVKITVGNQALTATLIDNATTRRLIDKFPLTVPMMNLYSREMCYRFPESLPANEARTSGYEIGDISYWTPRHSFVVFYKQNGEVISNLQKIGRIDSGVEIFEKTGDVDVTFELLSK